MGGGKRGGGAKKEAEGGSKAAAAKAARGGRPSSPQPPPAAGWADSEGERGARNEAWAPQRSADGALCRFCYREGSCAAPGSDESPVEVHTAPRSGRLTCSLRPPLGQ